MRHGMADDDEDFADAHALDGGGGGISSAMGADFQRIPACGGPQPAAVGVVRLHGSERGPVATLARGCVHEPCLNVGSGPGAGSGDGEGGVSGQAALEDEAVGGGGDGEGGLRGRAIGRAQADESECGGGEGEVE